MVAFDDRVVFSLPLKTWPLPLEIIRNITPCQDFELTRAIHNNEAQSLRYCGTRYSARSPLQKSHQPNTMLIL